MNSVVKNKGIIFGSLIGLGGTSAEKTKAIGESKAKFNGLSSKLGDHHHLS